MLLLRLISVSAAEAITELVLGFAFSCKLDGPFNDAPRKIEIWSLRADGFCKRLDLGDEKVMAAAIITAAGAASFQCSLLSFVISVLHLKSNCTKGRGGLGAELEAAFVARGGSVSLGPT